jgi:sialate O-acetylesterase
MMVQRASSVLFFLGVLSFASGLSADPRVPAIFGDNMVLQQQKVIPIWGTAPAGEELVVSFAGQTKKTVTAEDGRWQVKLDALDGSFEGRTLTITGKATLTFKNVLVGEVWLCSGQSNMQWTLQRARDAKAEIAAAKYPNIRLLTVKRTAKTKAQSDIQGRWAECNSKSASQFSAVGYFFGRHLHKELKVPVGLINSSWGGTRAEAWTSPAALKEQESLGALLKWWDQIISGYDLEKAKKNYAAALENWKLKRQKLKKKQRGPRKPRMRWDPAQSYHRPGNLYNGMIHPLIPFAIRGSIWYQGESNVSRAEQYKVIFPTLIKSWRSAWSQGDFPFYFVQLAPFRYGRADPACCAELWEAQLMTMKNVKNTGMAVITDIGHIKNIHPKNKQDVGRRLALWALAKDYGRKNLIFSGPIYKAMTRSEGKIIVQFDLHGSSLKSRDGKALTEFMIAGSDKKFHPAQAIIKDNVIEVSSSAVTKPEAVRFGWRDTANPNLVNKEGLPASPFRTDRWPAKTAGKHH